MLKRWKVEVLYYPLCYPLSLTPELYNLDTISSGFSFSPSREFNLFIVYMDLICYKP